MDRKNPDGGKKGSNESKVSKKYTKEIKDNPSQIIPSKKSSLEKQTPEVAKETDPIDPEDPTTVTENGGQDENQEEKTEAPVQEQPPQEECCVPRSYTMISTTFLSGGELQLPNIFNAFITGGKNVVKAIEMYAKDWTDELEIPLASYCNKITHCDKSETGLEDNNKGQAQKDNKKTSLTTKSDASAGPMTSSDNATTTTTTTKICFKKAPTSASSQTDGKEAPNICCKKVEKGVTVDMMARNNNNPHDPDSDKYQNCGVNNYAKQKESIFNLHPVETNIDLVEMKKASKVGLSNAPSGVSGLRKTIESRGNLNLKGSTPSQRKEKDFIDYFAEKEGSKYIGVLEQMETEFEQRMSMEMSIAPRAFQDESLAVARKISAIAKIKTVNEEKELQDYDFPMVIEHDITKFGIEVSRKINFLHKVHNYGVKMILHWIYLLQRRDFVSPDAIYAIGTEMLAVIMILCYGIFVRIGEYIVSLVDEQKRPLERSSVDKLVHDLRNLVDTISDEIGAIGESCGQVMIRIPNVPRRLVVETMTKLYTQVNYGNIAITRAIEALVPIVHCYALIEIQARNQKNKSKKSA